ncbi:ABC transporter permease subunit [Paenibacillus sp. LMG 31458]|uniref:ABC transporter permease subunit n=2 Tax=Paenibacillus TaxID=44249 RepID=A0ABX1Z4E1_9BACL|nr:MULTISPECIES: sugar ABC transporter permease [Paenibacillus]NOU74783.1 ABC transporter permease subunit [Paenibacillus phytorum]NOU88243.1 ABC transporter permease subunit [Paenibacillus germinis]
MEKINTLTHPAKKKFRHGYSLERREKQVGFIFAIPSIIGFFLFVLLPILGIFFLSFYKVDLMSGDFSFEGLKYYSKMIHEEDFWKSVQNTGIYLVIYVPLTLVLGLAMALILNAKLYMRGLVRTFFIIPYITTYVATLVVWNVFLHPTQGPLNSLLMSLGVSTPPQYMVDTHWALPVLAIIGAWKDVGYHCILFLAALQAVSTDYYESSSIDGANLMQRFRHITLPLISPTTFFLLLITIIGGLQAFYQMALMTKGGPAFSSTTLTYYIYRSAFEFSDFSYASAIGVFLFLITLLLIWINWIAQKKWVFYQ